MPCLPLLIMQSSKDLTPFLPRPFSQFILGSSFNLIFLSRIKYNRTMNHRICIKLGLGILAFSLLIPMVPTVSLAQAKLCCKKLCPKNVKQAPLRCHGSHATPPLSHKEPEDCCKTNCIRATLIMPSAAWVSLPAGKTTLNPIKIFPKVSGSISISLYRASLPGFQDPSHSTAFASRTAPFFLTHSAFLL